MIMLEILNLVCSLELMLYFVGTGYCNSTIVGTEIRTVDFRLNKEIRKTLISRGPGYLLIPHVKQSEYENNNDKNKKSKRGPTISMAQRIKG